MSPTRCGRLCLLTMALALALLTAAQAGPAEIPPGRYVLEGDSGALNIRLGKQGLRFAIESTGGNCHSCSVKGVIVGTVGRADNWAEDGSDSNCRIAFAASDGTISVNAITPSECRNYCGARASFDGSYRTPPAACTGSARKAKREQFRRAYRSQRYAEATARLQGLLAQCAQFMGWIERDQVRNDLALAQYHQGEARECLATLGETLAAKVSNEKELQEGVGDIYLPPCDFDNYAGVAKATWFNKALCAKAAR